MFQFHYGTIKRKRYRIAARSFVGFNSTMVRLKEYNHALANIRSSSFNSTMVRLKVVLERQACCIHFVSIPLWYD